MEDPVIFHSEEDGEKKKICALRYDIEMMHRCFRKKFVKDYMMFIIIYSFISNFRCIHIAPPSRLLTVRGHI